MPKDKHHKLKAISALRDQGLSEYIIKCVDAVTFAKAVDPNLQPDDILAEVGELAGK